MMTQRPSFVLFDLGNVLVHISPEAFLQRLGLDTPDRRRFYQAHINEIVRQYECGNESTDQFLSRLELLLNGKEVETANGVRMRAIQRDEVRDAMLAVIGKPVEGMFELVAKLSGSVPLGLLSNTNPLHFDWSMEHLPVLRHISSLFLSYRLRSLKPDARIFDQVLTSLQVAPGSIFYIDDMPENVDAGKNAGLNSHLFRGREGLERELRQMGLD
jgi:HAD superfamily hydrolase (TIGR01509 family)